PDPYEAAVLDALGDVSGLEVLDAGCGAGDLTLELLRRNARVTALDLSADLLAVARARVERFAGPEPPVRFVAAPLEDTGLPARAAARARGRGAGGAGGRAGRGRGGGRCARPGAARPGRGSDPPAGRGPARRRRAASAPKRGRMNAIGGRKAEPRPAHRHVVQ